MELYIFFLVSSDAGMIKKYKQVLTLCVLGQRRKKNQSNDFVKLILKADVSQLLTAQKTTKMGFHHVYNMMAV